MILRRLRGAAVVGVATSGLMASLWSGVIGSQPAYASCDTGFSGVSGTDAAYSGFQGVTGNWVAFQFSTVQCSSVRSIVARNWSGSNQAEFGWFTQGSATNHVPFAVWMVDGVYHEHDNPGGISNMGVQTSGHKYELVNANVNTYWAWNFDGTYLESHQISALTTADTVITNSERHNGNDSLWAHFYYLNDCRSIDNCTWWGFKDLEQAGNTTQRWLFCKSSATGHYVKLDAC